MKNVVILLAEGFEEVEALTPYDFLKRAGLEVKTLKVADFAKDVIVTASHKLKIKTDMLLSDYISQNIIPDCIIIPGGMPGALNVAKSNEALNLIKQVYNKGNIVAAICAAPVVVIAKAGLLHDKKFTCYPQMEDEYAPDCKKNKVDAQVVNDGNLVTARGAGASMEFALKLVELLLDKDTSINLAKRVCMP